MVEKQIEFTTFKTSTIELDCGCSRKLKFTSERSSFMNYKRNKQARPNSSRTAPAQRELTVGTLLDIFYLKDEIDAAYRDHVHTLELIITSYHDPECGMLIKDDTIAYIVDWVQSRGYDLFKDETLLGHFSTRRIVRLSFTARIGVFPSWPKEPKEDKS